MSIPIVFVHKGNSSYLFDTFYQLKSSNKSTTVYLIGTKESHIYSPLVTNIDIATYSNDSEQFKNIYRHFSTNSYEFELICIQRWFILRDFLIKNGIKRCLYLDSDIFVYSDINELANRFMEYGMTICGISGHINFLEVNTLIDFCNYITSSYTNEKSLKELETHFQQEYINRQQLGGISDMTFFYRYSLNNPDKVCNLYHLDVSAGAFDPSMENGEDRYYMDGKLKKVVMKNGKPYCLRLSDKMPVLHHILHFQGAEAKKKMPNYISCKTPAYHVQQLYYNCFYLLQKFLKKVGL